MMFQAYMSFGYTDLFSKSYWNSIHSISIYCVPVSILDAGNIDHLSLAWRKKYENKLKESLPQLPSLSTGPMPLTMEGVQTPLEPRWRVRPVPLPDDFVLSLGRLLGHPVKRNMSIFYVLIFSSNEWWVQKTWSIWSEEFWGWHICLSSPVDKPTGVVWGSVCACMGGLVSTSI